MSRKVPFLIIGLTGPIGAGCTTLATLIKRTKPNDMIKFRKQYEKVVEDIKEVSNKMKLQKAEGNRAEIEKLNELLLKDYEERATLSECLKFENPEFCYISMSALIIKLSLEFLKSNEYLQWKKENVLISEKLEEFYNNFSNEINIFNINSKDFSKLSNKELLQIDNMFYVLQSLTKEIKRLELIPFLSGEKDKFLLQEWGDNLRCNGNPFNYNTALKLSDNNLKIISKEVNKVIKYYHNRCDGKKLNCFIVDAFRNSSEIEFFRDRYEQFFLISIYADREVRKGRLRREFLNSSNFKMDEDTFSNFFNKMDDKDWGDDSNISSLNKQNVSRCCYLSDIAINNNIDSVDFNDDLFKRFIRYYALIISPGCLQPNIEEMYMNLAYSLSLKSSCISRKVGAVITDKTGYILGLGWNDVTHGIVGCGLRNKEDFTSYLNDFFGLDIFKGILSPEDLKDYEEGNSICFKDVLSSIKIKEKISKLKIADESKDEIIKKLKIKRLEFCRALHAEENALLQVATRGGVGVNHGIIYTTTFPCELCAKKIYQSGIKKIVYTEPYPDSISENVFLKDGIPDIEIKQFEGVKSSSYFKLFKPKYDKKEAQLIDF